ncbi:MAG: hypothetical protein JO214_16020 [Frankiaceae bacterium]|nr:hypothetical protein [Frankiaceae bacterium]
MGETARTRVIIGITAAVWFVVALVSGPEGVAEVSLRAFSLAASVVTILLLLYEKWLWRWKAVRYFTKKPLLEGTWRGTLKSDYVPPGKSEPVPPIPTVIRIRQTDTTLFVTQFTSESTSTTEQGRLSKEADGRWRISWLYTNQPRPTIQDRSAVHRGAADLWLSGSHGEVLDGGYFTGRKTRGDLLFDEWCSVPFADASSAFQSLKFVQAHPFVRDDHL